jgi:cytochrome bd ubiquinol oxidase subunit II
MNVALLALVVLWWGLIAYAVLGGADFGAGVWALFAFGRQAERQREFINHALGPVWEANHVWLIFLIVGLFNVFPSAFASLSIALFVPFTLALVGIVLRGAAFIFRYYAIDERGPFARVWARVFSVSSLLTPFFLGAGAAAVASGHLLADNGTAQAGRFASWTSPFALTIGAMAVTLCGTLAAVYLAEEASQAQDTELMQVYRMRALIAGAVTAIFGAVGLYFSTIYAPLLWAGMLLRAIPVVIATMIIGMATALSLYLRYYRRARVMIIAETAFLLGSWGLSQYPYIIPPHVTIDAAANEPYVITTLLICIAIGLVILIPSLYYLYSVFKLSYPVPGLRRDVIERDKKDNEDSENRKGVEAT